jgi:phosphatidylserine/phosphatidylglycerophosphate/cardiolipin synthase-like enzyme
MHPRDALLNQIVMVATRVPSPALARFCDALELLAGKAGPEQWAPLTKEIQDPEVRSALNELVTRCSNPGLGLSSLQLASALRASSATDEFHRARQSIEMVWTGPSFRGPPFRRTDQALLELIGEARRTLMLVTFAAYRVPHVTEALLVAATRGVQIVLILESTEESSGHLTLDAISAFGEDLVARSKVYFWPLEKRERDAQGHHGCLHVKCAVADDRLALISSANLTEFAMTLNMELGVLTRGGDLPRALAGHLNALIVHRILVPFP